MTITAGYLDAKQRFTVQVKHGFEQLVREAVAMHPVLRLLPEQDRTNIARCAARHGLLAIRAQSVNDVLNKLDQERPA